MKLNNVSNQDTQYTTYIACPACESKFVQGEVCACGFGAQKSKSIKLEKRERATILAFVIFSFILLFSYYQLMHWGSFALRVPILKTEKLLGVMDSKSYMELADICNARANVKCVQQTYHEMYQHTKNVEALSMLAQFEARNHDLQTAISDFDAYFKGGGKNSKIPFQYAMVLEENHNYEASLRFLSLAIHQNSGKRSLLATAEMLRIYMAQQKYEQAQRLLENFWSHADKQRAYFNAEESQIQGVLGPQKTARL